MSYWPQVQELLQASRVQLSDLRPSEWAERNIVITQGSPGPLRYSVTPYSREIIDRFAQDDPAREIAIMGAAQWGKSASILIPLIGYIIANDPGNTIMTVGHDDLIEEAMGHIDAMLDNSNLRRLIRSSAQRARQQKTGDTNTRKEFPNGYFKLSSASNAKIWRQSSYKFGLIDDFDAVKSSTKAAGDTRDLILKRFTANHKTKKILYVSSPELEETSNIYKLYKYGDQRKFLVPCPCCGEFIELLWTVEGKDGKQAGIFWKLDDENKLIPESVGYICQKCDDFFTDQHKSDIVNKGYWEPTAKPTRADFYSYYMSSLYSPPFMSDWEHYVYQYLDCNPIGQPRNETKYQTFLNVDLGLPYQKMGESPKANDLQKNNIRNYEIGVVPETLSIKDGNGRIVLLTCACDLNGKIEDPVKGWEDDARLDYEIVAWSENGSTYSVDHGSIGTFIPNESGKKNKDDREKWSYQHHKPNNVWKELDKILARNYEWDNKRQSMRIFMTGIDTGHGELQAFTYIDNSRYAVVGLKGDKEHKYVRYGVELPNIRKGQSRGKLYLLRVGQIKDDVAELIRLRWNSKEDAQQPSGFMNFPQPANGKYYFKNFFEHYESEARILDKENNFIWQKKTANAQNHMWDCRIYNMAMREIILQMCADSRKVKSITWKEFVDIIAAASK